VPIAIRYQYTRPMRKQVIGAIERLEEYLKIDTPDGDDYERLRTIGAHVVAGYESAYGVRPDKDATLNDRIQHMKNLWVDRSAKAVGIEDNPELPLGDRVRTIINALDRINVTKESASDFEKTTFLRRQRETEPLYKDLERAMRFLATATGYVAEDKSDQRFLEVISQIEEELFGYSPVRGPRKAIVTIGEPIDISQDEADKDAVHVTTVTVENAIRKMLSVKTNGA